MDAAEYTSQPHEFYRIEDVHLLHDYLRLCYIDKLPLPHLVIPSEIDVEIGEENHANWSSINLREGVLNSPVIDKSYNES
jgi:hypothetical protein